MTLFVTLAAESLFDDSSPELLAEDSNVLAIDGALEAGMKVEMSLRECQSEIT